MTEKYVDKAASNTPTNRFIGLMRRLFGPMPSQVSGSLVDYDATRTSEGATWVLASCEGPRNYPPDGITAEELEKDLSDLFS